MKDNMPMHYHGYGHICCCLKPLAGKILWVLSFLTLIGGLFAHWQGGTFWGVSVLTWYWNALVGGVLALGLKGRGSHGYKHCLVCKPEGGHCETCIPGNNPSESK